jgi:putative PIN family toxin of toxin-antitoxin system
MGTRSKVVLDTNVFISAFGWRGIPWSIVDLVRSGSIINHTSAEMLEELRRVVAYPKLKFSAQLQTDIIEFVLAHSNLLIPAAVTDLIIDDPDDLKVISCAVAAKAQCIISGDPHLLDLGSYRTIAIFNPAAFISSIR